MNALSIRPLAAGDLPTLHQMVTALASHHGDTATITMDDLRRDCLGPHPWLHVLIAELGVGAMGYAALCPLAQMLFGARGMDMHHLFVQKNARGHGVGQALIAAAIDLADRLACRFLTVGTHPDNHHAAEVYRAAGFEQLGEAGPRFRMMLTGNGRLEL